MHSELCLTRGGRVCANIIIVFARRLKRLDIFYFFKSVCVCVCDKLSVFLCLSFLQLTQSHVRIVCACVLAALSFHAS